jgi:hypothetical protein
MAAAGHSAAASPAAERLSFLSLPATVYPRFSARFASWRILRLRAGLANSRDFRRFLPVQGWDDGKHVFERGRVAFKS